MSTKQLKQSGASTTIERLLDTAERLFAKYGYDGVGIRALAQEAGVNLGATTYHYGSKEKLYIEASVRRFRPLVDERVDLLRRAEKASKGKPLSVETIVDCMVRPPFMTVLAYPYFIALLSRNLFMPPPFMQESLLKEFASIDEPFVAAFVRTLPELPLEVLQLRVEFSGSMLFMFFNKLSQAPMRSKPALCEAVLKEMVAFISAGIRADRAALDTDLQALVFHWPY
jgi:AcrR family transcriptional regulator